MTSEQYIAAFQAAVWQYYDAHARHDLPWRQPEPVAGGGLYFDPYKILVSEIMLQQTQVGRVVPKYLAFLELFPSVDALAAASLGDVLVAWQGLGYNRRAKFLWQAARLVIAEYGGEFPREQRSLTALPGAGLNTAGAVAAYAYNAPVTFIETNIRTVFIHHFFSGRQAVGDKEILPLVQATLPAHNPREWYWALMDYGTHIKQQHGNKARASKSYAKQSPFEGSRRKVRGAVIRYLSQRPGTLEELAGAEPDSRLAGVLDDLAREGMVVLEPGPSGRYRLT